MVSEEELDKNEDQLKDNLNHRTFSIDIRLFEVPR
jgi:hypothetical protein